MLEGLIVLVVVAGLAYLINKRRKSRGTGDGTRPGPGTPNKPK